jgi:c-di-GMP-binding flagellar brake protein YcgR
MREKRRYVRANGLVLVNYKIPNLEIEGKSSAYDVSGGGLRITVNQKLELGTLIEMEIYLPGSSQPILAKGEVVWTQRLQEKIDAPLAEEKKYFYVGIKFNVIDENSKNRIINYVFRKYH